MLTPGHERRLRERGLDPQTAQALGVHSAPDGTAILFHYLARGHVHNTKIRRGKGNMPWALTDKPLILWNIDSLQAPPESDQEPLIITEGEFDTLALLAAGYRRVVSVPNGAPSSPNEAGDKRFAYLFRPGTADLLGAIDQFKTVVLAVDGDAKGQYLRDALAVRIGDDRCWWVQWPEGCKDANDTLIKYGVDNLRSIIAGSKRMWLEHVARMSDIPDADDIAVYTLGDPMMDQPIEDGGVRIPQVGFITISGPANMGKSTFVRQLAWHLWRTYGAPFAITAFEEDAKPVYQNEFRRLGIGKNPRMATMDEIGRIDIEMDSAFVVIQRPNEGSVTVERLLSNIEFAVKVYGVRVVIIDPANEVEREDSPQETGRMIMQLQALAKRYRFLVICLAHPPVEMVRKKRAQDLWTLYDVESGRHWAGKSDAGFMLWRHGEHTMCHVAKLKRFFDFGRPALYQLTHDRDRNMFVASGKGDHLLQQAATDAKVNGNGHGQPRYSGKTA